MSNIDRSYDNGSYSSEYDADRGIELHEPHVPANVEELRRTTPVVGGRPPALISNRDLLDQLYLMGDALNQYQERLDSMESRIEGRSGRRDRRDRAPGRQSDHAPGKQPMIEGGAPVADGQPERRFQMITPRQLEYSSDVHTEVISDRERNLTRPNEESRVVPRPHHTGCAPSGRKK